MGYKFRLRSILVLERTGRSLSPPKVFSQIGMTLIEIMIVIGFFAALSMGFLATVAKLMGTNQMSLKLWDITNLKVVMVSAIQQPNYCNNVLNPNSPGNASNPYNTSSGFLRFDSTQTTPQFIDLGSFWMGSSYNSNNVVAQEYSATSPTPAMTTEHGLQVTNVSIQSLQKVPGASTPYLWQGVWTVTFIDPVTGVAPPPLQVPQYFYLDQTSDPTNTFIITCQSDLQCPGGFTMIGSPTAAGSFCIDTSPRPQDTFWNAKKTCAGLAAQGNYSNPVAAAGFGTGHLCDEDEFAEACKNRSIAMANANVFIDSFDGFSTVTAAGTPPAGYLWYGTPNQCSARGWGDFTTQQQFYCCLD